MESPPSFRKQFAFQPAPRLTPHTPRPWPVDPELSRRVEQTRRQIERTRRQLKLDVLAARKRRSRRGVAPAPTLRPIHTLPSSDDQGEAQ
jgi:hypothetical protein